MKVMFPGEVQLGRDPGPQGDQAPGLQGQVRDPIPATSPPGNDSKADTAATSPPPPSPHHVPGIPFFIIHLLVFYLLHHAHNAFCIFF